MRTRADSPPEKRWPRGEQTFTIYIERPWVDGELEADIEFDEGRVCRATVAGVEIELTADEKESAEVDYSEQLTDREDAAREDDADRRADR